ncbi:protein-L-isoaspartate O-methyltransferase [Patescibacteria group bacterium]|nr:protein-L-isoaspartate O-methyltransferase [Patescibacteria group bacterium]
MTKEALINELVKDGYLKTTSIIEAFGYVDRKNFVPEDQVDYSYENNPLPIGFGQTISQPLAVAFMIELLGPKKGEKILDIGTGSGWQTALLAFLVKDEEEKSGRIVSVERVPELKDFAEKNIGRYEDLKEYITLFSGDGSLGVSQEAPFDKIIAAASASKVPSAWKDELKIGGRIVAPIKESIIVLDKISKDEFNERQYFGFSFVPLIEGVGPHI